jgi:hypothetical protein
VVALVGLLVIILLSIIVVRIGAIALELTGLSSEIASFQSQSAFSGVGFTTAESETIVSHPVRRKIIRILILVGSAGLTTSMATLVLTFVGEKGKDVLERGMVLIAGLLIIFLFARSKIIYRMTRRIISSALKKWTKIHIFDYEQILGFAEGYTISRVVVKKDSWLNDKKLGESRLEQEGVLVLAVYRRVDGREQFIGGLSGDFQVKAGDALICYSRKDVSEVLSAAK